MISREAYIRWHALRAFFESYESWLACRGWVGLTDEIPRDTYQRLLMGTDADCYVPLWASACLSGEDVLLNETTLAVIAAYKKWGYQWVDMDGNPPDYIGQQCRFMEYLCVCGLKTGDEALEQAGQEFCDRFLLGTAHRVAEAARENDLGEAVEKVLALLKEAAALAPARVQDPGGALPFDSTQWERGPQLELEPPRVVGHASFCDCGNKCRMLSTVQEGCVLSILPDKDFMGKSFSGCPRGMAYRQTFLNSRRLRYPMVRTGRRGEGKFRRISWPEAETLVAEAVRDSRERFGPASRYVMAAAGVCALMRPDRCMKHLLSCDGGYLDFYNFYSAACAEHVLPYIYGTVACGSPERQLLQSKLLLLWGHNPVDTHFGDNHTELFVQAKGSGIRVIVIDPRCSDTARLFADQWIPIRPSTDGALADAMAYVIWSRGLQDQAFMDTYCLGFDEEHMPPGVLPGESYHSYLFGRKDHVEKTPEWAAAITGVPADVIEALAVEYATTKPACLLPGLGPQRTLNGEQNCRSFAMLACLTGNVGVAGGSAGAVSYLKESHAGVEFLPMKNPCPGAIPSFLWSRAVERPETIDRQAGLTGAEKLETGIKTIFCLASGMLVNQHSHVNETVRILEQEDLAETIVVSDLFMTPGARYADLLLPGVSFFETENVVNPWAGGDYVLYDHQAVKPLFGARLEYEWMLAAADQLGCGQAFCQGTREAGEWLARRYEEHRSRREPALPPFEVLRRQGGFVYPQTADTPAFQRNIRDKEPFATPSGKIEIFSQRLYDSGVLPGVPCYTPCEEGWEDACAGPYPLQLIGYHSKRRCHSIGELTESLKGLDEQQLWMHPRDAGPRGIRDGDLVEVFNSRGVVCLPVWVTERIVPGTVAMSEGAWFTPDAKGRDRRGCINVLTMTHRATPLAHGNPQHTNLVQVRLAMEK